MVVTDDAGLADSMRVIAGHGSRVRYYHEVLGLTAASDTLQGGDPAGQLPHLPEYNTARRKAAARYGELLRVFP